jgi:hypothetical protein
MKDIYVYGIGLTAAGMSTWVEGAAILRGDRFYDKTELPDLTPQLLRPDEKLRTTALIKLALHVAEQATDNSAISAENPGFAKNLCSVFASSEGDMALVDKICDALSMTDRPISPNQIHNCAHNAPAAYWSIATCNHLASVSLSSGPGSYAGGLLEAAGLSTVEKCPTLLVSYDWPPPEALKPLIPIQEAFGSALIVGSEPRKHSLAKIQLALGSEEETTLDDSALETLRLSNPAARALTVLKVIACKQAQTVVLPYLEGQNLSVTCTPCL